MKPRIVFTALLLLLGLKASVFAQVKLYEDSFNGGVAGGGYSIGATVPSGSGSFAINIPAGSSIRRAYLIGSRVGPAPDITITLNGSPYTFTAGNNITSGFQTIYGGASGVHAIDITGSISPATSLYTIAVPAQSNTVSNKYTEFYLYIAYNNPGMQFVNTAVFINNTNLNVGSYSWALNTTTAVTNAFQVGMAVMGGYAAVSPDCEQVIVNGTNLGSFGGQDFNAASSWGCMAGFQYGNNTLTGMGDDNANQAIAGTDALSNIQGVLPASTNSIPVTFSHCNGGGDNHVWAVFLSWGGVVLDDEALHLVAKAEDSHVNLTWEAGQSQQMTGYTVQRSRDGNDFADLAHIPQKSSLFYDWVDESPNAGSNWYRLMGTGIDGTVYFSEIHAIDFAPNHALVAALSPNPVHAGGELSLQLYSFLPVSWSIFNLSDGREILTGQHSPTDLIHISTEGMLPGMYGIQVKAEGKLQVLRFVVER